MLELWLELSQALEEVGAWTARVLRGLRSGPLWLVTSLRLPTWKWHLPTRSLISINDLR